MRVFCLVALLAAMAAVAMPAEATPIVVAFEGIIDQSLDPTIPVGSAFSGIYAIDPASVSLDGSTGTVGSYAISPAGSLRISVAGTVLLSDLTAVAVINDDPGLGDAWLAAAEPGAGPRGTPGQRIDFLDSTGARLDSTAFFVNTSLAGWTEARFSKFGPSLAKPVLFSGSIHTLTLIPEPSTMILVGLGLCALAAGRRAQGEPPRSGAGRRSASFTEGP